MRFDVDERGLPRQAAFVAAGTIDPMVRQAILTYGTYTVTLPPVANFAGQYLILQATGGTVAGGETVTIRTDVTATEYIHIAATAVLSIAFSDATSIMDYAILYCDGNRWYEVYGSYT